MTSPLAVLSNLCPNARLEDVLEVLLGTKGYTVVRKLGEGNTRDVYEVEYTSGSLRKRRVAKVPKTEIDETSIKQHIL